MIATIRPSIRLSHMLSSPKPLDEIQPKSLVNSLLTYMGRATAHFWPRLLRPWGGVKRGSSTFKKSQFQRFFIPNYVCVLTNKIYKTYRTEFSFCCLCHASDS